MKKRRKRLSCARARSLPLSLFIQYYSSSFFFLLRLLNGRNIRNMTWWQTFLSHYICLIVLGKAVDCHCYRQFLIELDFYRDRFGEIDGREMNSRRRRFIHSNVKLSQPGENLWLWTNDRIGKEEHREREDLHLSRILLLFTKKDISESGMANFVVVVVDLPTRTCYDYQSRFVTDQIELTPQHHQWQDNTRTQAWRFGVNWMSPSLSSESTNHLNRHPSITFAFGRRRYSSAIVCREAKTLVDDERE